MNSTAWLDEFLFWDCVIVALLIFADWLIGKEKRVAMREKIGEWWLHVQEVSFSGLVAEDAGIIRRVLQRFFGKMYGFKCILLTIVFSLSATIIYYYIYMAQQYQEILSEDPANFFSFINELTSFLLAVIYFWGFPIILVSWLSLILTVFLLKFMERSANPLLLILFILIDIFGIIILVNFAFILGTLFLPQITGRASGIFVTVFVTVGSTMAITCSIPTILHLILSFVFILSKLFRPLIQKPTSLVLIRFHESEKGILTQLATGAGAVAKLIQETAKYLSNTL